MAPPLLFNRPSRPESRPRSPKPIPPIPMKPPADSPHEPAEVKGVGIADLCIKRPVFATMINLFIVVLGWFSLSSIGIDQFPNVELPVITVTTTLRGASPEEMETSVTKPLEEIIN